MASGLSYIKYGNVNLYRVVTRDVRQEPVFDDSHTDLLYFKTTIDVSGVLNGHNEWLYQFQAPVATTGNASDAWIGVSYQLPPRQPFEYWVGVPDQIGGAINVFYIGGEKMLYANPAPLSMVIPVYTARPPQRPAPNINLAGIDLSNGPRCTSFRITQVVGDEVFRVDASFEICTLACQIDGSVPGNTYGVLSNRWGCRDSIDSLMRTTRTYTGSATLASANLNAQMLRGFLAPPLQPLFRRDHMTFAVSPDQLKINWEVVDQEIAVSAPFPARKWSVKHTVRQGSTNPAMMGSSSIDIYLEGDSIVNKGDLINLAMYIITDRLMNMTPPEFAALPVKGLRLDAMGNVIPMPFIVRHLEMTDHIGDINAISASCVVDRIMNVTDGMLLIMSRFGAPFDPLRLPPPNDGSGQGVGDLPPYNAGVGSGVQYNPALSFGAYQSLDAKPIVQKPATQGPALAIGVFASFLQSPCNNNHTIVSGASLPP